MKRILPLLLATAFASSGVQAADLLSVYRDALGYDAQFGAARAERDAGLEKLPQARVGLKPQINLSADTKWNDMSSRLRTSPEISLDGPAGIVLGPFIPQQSSTRYNTHSWMLTLAQPLFRWQNWATYKQGELASKVAEVQYTNAKQDLIERVTQAYFDVLLAQEDLKTAEAQKTAIAEQLAAAKRNFEVGVTTITDTHEAQARHDLVTASVIAADNALQVKRHALRMLIGKEPDELKGLKSGVELAAPQPAELNPWVESAERDNLNVQMTRLNLEIADREIEKQKSGRYPTVDLTASHGRTTSGTNSFLPALGGSVSDVTMVGLQLNIPIFDGGLTTSKSRESVALREKARLDLENVRRISAQAARQSYLGVTSGLAQVKALEQSVISSQSALDSNKLGYEVGVRVNIDVLNAQQQLYSTRRDLAKARLQTLTAQLKLKAVTGSLTEQDLAGVNGMLE